MIHFLHILPCLIVTILGFQGPNMGADDTGRVDPKTVQYCHANYESICYNGMFPLVDQGYQASFIKTLCGHYRSMLVQTCRTQQGLWKKIDETYCKLYIANCMPWEEEHKNAKGGMGLYDYSNSNHKTVDRKYTKFNTVCPNFDQRCNIRSVSKYTVCQTFKFTAKHTCSQYRNPDYKRGCERYKQHCSTAGK